MKQIYIISKVTFDDQMFSREITRDNVWKLNEAFISINDTCGTDERPYFPNNRDNVLVQFFDDIEKDLFKEKYGNITAFTAKQAMEIIDFLEKNRNKDSLTIHCTAGICRSGAVGEFACRYYELDYKQFRMNNPQILPNPHVLQMLTHIHRLNTNFDYSAQYCDQIMKKAEGKIEEIGKHMDGITNEISAQMEEVMSKIKF